MARWSPLLAFLALSLAYGLTLCPTVYVEGSGELIGASYYLGTPHPTGYPLFALGARLLASLLPWGSPAQQINAAAALFAALAGAALSWLLCRRGLDPWAALAAGLFLGFSQTFWSQAVIAEVYGLSLLLALATMGWALRAAAAREERALLLTAFLFGLGATAHLNQVLLAPALLALFAWRWPDLWRRGRLLSGALLCLLCGYSLVLYLPLRNGLGPGFHWGDVRHLEALWRHLTAALYRDSFFALPLEGLLLNGRRWIGQVSGEFGPGSWLLLPLGLWLAWRRDRSLLLVGGGTGLANVFMVLNYHRDPNGLGVFFLLGFACMGIFIGLALDALGRRLPPPARPLSVLLVLVPLLAHARAADHSQRWIAYQYGMDILADLPAGAALIAEGDDASFVLDYLWRVEKERPDIALYNRLGRGTDLLSAAERRLAPAAQWRLQRRREADLARSGRPLFYLVARRPPQGYEFAPAGLVYQLLPAGDERGAGGLDVPIEMDNARRAVPDPWARKIQGNYWFMEGERQRRRGFRDAALKAYARAAEVARDSRTMRFNVALMMWRLGAVARARRHAEAAVAIDPFQPAARRLLARIHAAQGREYKVHGLHKNAGNGRLQP